MINWFDMPAEGLSNGGQFEVKELEVTENGTYEEKGEMYNKVTVNVEGGGGGSSDFSTAKVTVINSSPLREYINAVNIVDEDDSHMLDTEFNIGQGTNEFQCVLYKGHGWIDTSQFTNSAIEVSGNATYDGEYSISITGDCTITISKQEQ